MRVAEALIRRQRQKIEQWKRRIVDNAKFMWRGFQYPDQLIAERDTTYLRH